uniref:Uncharacterized protein n=1 Tax=Oryza barthii TaxID=65489 RepID=A0A0D3HVG2_9ORYZ
MVTDVAATKLAMTVADCGVCRDAGPRRRGALVNAPAVNAVPVTPSSMMPATRALRCTSDPRHPGWIWTTGIWRRLLATVAADGGGWMGVSVVVAVAVAMVADGGGWQRWWLWQWRWQLSTMGIAGESLVEPFGWLTTATPFGVVPLLGGVHTPFLSLPYSLGKNLASVLNERWRRSTSHPPWGHRFGEISSCKDIVIGLCIGFEL